MSSQEFKRFSCNKLICRIAGIRFAAHEIQHFNGRLF